MSHALILQTLARVFWDASKHRQSISVCSTAERHGLLLDARIKFGFFWRFQVIRRSWFRFVRISSWRRSVPHGGWFSPSLIKLLPRWRQKLLSIFLHLLDLCSSWRIRRQGWIVSIHVPGDGISTSTTTVPSSSSSSRRVLVRSWIVLLLSHGARARGPGFLRRPIGTRGVEAVLLGEALHGLTAIGSHYVAFLSISVSFLMNAVVWCVCVCTTSVGLK